MTLSNGFDGFIDFTLTDTTGVARSLTGFHFDTGAFRPSAAIDWELEVLAGGDLTAGSLATGIATVSAGPMEDDVTINLTGLTDSTLDANGSVTFRLNFTGGGGDAGAAANGHHLFLDNVGVTGLSLGQPGDYNGDGVVDLADYTVWRDHLGAVEDGTILSGNGNGGVVDATDYTFWKSNYGSGTASIAVNQAIAVPEPSNLFFMALGFTAAIANRRRTTKGCRAYRCPISIDMPPRAGIGQQACPGEACCYSEHKL